MGCGRNAAVGSSQAPAAWQEAELQGSAELLHRTGNVTPAARGKRKQTSFLKYSKLKGGGGEQRFPLVSTFKMPVHLSCLFVTQIQSGIS